MKLTAVENGMDMMKESSCAENDMSLTSRTVTSSPPKRRRADDLSPPVGSTDVVSPRCKFFAYICAEYKGIFEWIDLG